MAAVAAASVAGVTALATYLDGKYNLKQDLRYLYTARAARKYCADLGMSFFSHYSIEDEVFYRDYESCGDL